MSTNYPYRLLSPNPIYRILSSLDERNQKALISSSANPNPSQHWTSQPTTAGGKSAFSQSTTSVPPRPSIKETIAAQKKAAKAAGKNLPSRPGSAEPFGSPKKSASQMSIGRPATAMSNASRNVSTTSAGTLSSAPVRPRRRADIARPATADPQSRKPIRMETPPKSPVVSPVKRVKTPGPTASTVKLANRKPDSPAAASPAKGSSSNRFGFSNETRFVDSIQPQLSPTKAAEDFTMVIPNMNPLGPESSAPAGNFPQMAHPDSPPEVLSLDDPFSPMTPDGVKASKSVENRLGWNDTSSNDRHPHLSPTKLLHEFHRFSFDEDKSQKFSMSPRAIASKKESPVSKGSFTQDQRPLKVYEDPVRDSTNGSSYPSPITLIPRALEELPVNEPVKNRQAPEPQLLAEEAQSPEYHQKWLAMEAAERRRLSMSENVENPRTARKVLDSGIDRLRAKSLDVHGFRKLQSLIRTSKDAIWEDGYKFDELILPLLEYLEAPNEDVMPRSGKTQDLKAQDLMTIRLLLQHQSKYFTGYYPRALTAVLTARKYYNSTSHLVCGLEETAESIVHQCDPTPCIDSVLDLLEDQGSSAAETNTVFMGLYTLAGLLHGTREKSSTMRLTEDQEARLGSTGAKYIVNTNPDIRRAVIEFVLELHDTVDQDRFWALVARGRDDHRSLITYYLARKRAIAH